MIGAPPYLAHAQIDSAAASPVADLSLHVTLDFSSHFFFFFLRGEEFELQFFGVGDFAARGGSSRTEAGLISALN